MSTDRSDNIYFKKMHTLRYWQGSPLAHSQQLKNSNLRYGGTLYLPTYLLTYMKRNRNILTGHTKYCTYICRVQSYVWRLPKYWPPTPSPTQRGECVLPPHQRRGEDTLAGRWGSGGSIFWETPDIGLVSYSIISLRLSRTKTKPESKFLNF
jgi:hypothetical protein